MALLKRLFGKKEEQRELRKLKLEEIANELRKIQTKIRENGVAQLQGLLPNIFNTCTQLQNTLETLTKAEPREEVHGGLYKTGVEARRLFVEKVHRALAEIRVIEKGTGDFELVDEKLTKMVNLTSSAMVSHGRYLRVVFQREMESVSTQLAKLHKLCKEVHTKITEFRRKEEELTPIMAKVNTQLERLKEVNGLKRKLEEMKKRIHETEKHLMEEEAQLSRHLKSSEFLSVSALREELKRVEEEITSTKEEVIRIFSSLGRLFRKLEKLVELGRVKMDKELVTSLKLATRDPLALIQTEEKVLATQKVLEVLLNSLQVGEIEAEPRERKKRIDAVDELLKTSRLQKLKTHLDELKHRQEGKMSMMEETPYLRKREIESRIKELRQQLEISRKNVRELETKITLLNDEIARGHTEIEQETPRYLGIRVEVLEKR